MQNNITTTKETMTSTQLLELIKFSSKSELNRAIRNMFSDKIDGGQICSSLDSRGYVANYILPKKYANEFISYQTREFNKLGIKERAALDAIEQILGIKLERQVRVLSYRLDGYHRETNTAYEIDEHGHFRSGNLRSSDIERQRNIEQEIGCSFVRIQV